MKLPAEFAQASTGLPQESGVQNLIEFFKLLDSVGEGFSSAASLTRQQEETVYGNTLSSLENLIAESDNIDNHSFYQGELDKLGTDANFQSAILERPDLGLRFDEAQRVSSQRGQSLSDVKFIGQQLVNELYGDENFFGIAQKDLTAKNLLTMWEDLDPDYRKNGLFLKLKKEQDRLQGMQMKLGALFGGKEDGSYSKLPNLKFNYTTKNDAGEEISQEISFDEFAQQMHKYNSNLQGFLKSAIDDGYLSFDEASNFINMDYESFATMHENKQKMYKGIWEDSSTLRDNTINKLITHFNKTSGTDWEQWLKQAEESPEAQRMLMEVMASKGINLEGDMPFIMTGNPSSDLRSLMDSMRDGDITGKELKAILTAQSKILYERGKNAEEGLKNWGGGEFLFGYTPMVPLSLEDIGGDDDDVGGDDDAGDDSGAGDTTIPPVQKLQDISDRDNVSDVVSFVDFYLRENRTEDMDEDAKMNITDDISRRLNISPFEGFYKAGTVDEIANAIREHNKESKTLSFHYHNPGALKFNNQEGATSDPDGTAYAVFEDPDLGMKALKNQITKDLERSNKHYSEAKKAGLKYAQSYEETKEGSPVVADKETYDYGQKKEIPIPEIGSRGAGIIEGTRDAIQRKEKGEYGNLTTNYGTKTLSRKVVDEEIIKLNENILNLTSLLADDEYISNMPEDTSLKGWLGFTSNVTSLGLANALGVVDTRKKIDSNINEYSIKKHKIEISHLLNLNKLPETVKDFNMYNEIIDNLSKELRKDYKGLFGKEKTNTGQTIKYLSKLKSQLKRLHKKGGFSK